MYQMFRVLLCLLIPFYINSAHALLSTDVLVFEAEQPVEIRTRETGSLEFVTKPEIYLRVFRSPKGTYTLHANIDVSHVNQAILPTDKSGNLTKEAVALGFRPFVKFRLSSGTEKTVDVKCTTKICNAIYSPFPYNPQIETQSINVEVNIRGLQGKNWDINMSRIAVYNGVFSDIPFSQDVIKPSNGLNVLRYYQNNLLVPKNSQDPAEPLSVDDWTLRPPNDSGRTFVGPWIVSQKALIEIFQGDVQSMYSFDKKTLIRERLNSPQRLWVEPGLHLFLENASPNEARLRWIEFPSSPPEKSEKKRR